MGDDRLSRFRNLAAAWLSTAVWAAALYVVASPWRHLGGIVDERLRWLLRFGLAGGLWLGYVAADAFVTFALDPADDPLWNRRALRWLYYPAAIAGVAALVALDIAGSNDAIGVVTTALLAYGTGAWLRVAGLVGRSRPSEAPSEGEGNERD